MSTTNSQALSEAGAGSPEWHQSLADGAPGIALPHIEAAHAGTTGWKLVHQYATAMTRAPVHAHPDHTNLFRGAPAVAYTLHLAGHPAYRGALATLDHSINTLIQHRLTTAHQRINTGQLPHAGEYDLINGLTGLGAYLLHRHDDHELLRDILRYLVRLTHPIRPDGETLPGWWAAASPDRRRTSRWNGGHAGFGMAHGAAGPLALLSATMLRGITVTGHTDAIDTITAWYDQWQTGTGQQACWPEVIDRHELRTGTAAHPGPHRPSWCYGTPGITRAQQLAGQATNDQHRTHTAEQALLGCLTDDTQLAQITDAGLCHGWAGLAHTAQYAAAEATNDALAAAAHDATDRMRRHLHQHGHPTDPGLLEGAAGVALVDNVDHTAASAGPRWDTFLLAG
ncbi:lanthionine synthetase C family protein [Polymorphospora rubra]|uniref:lanthionine synthetase C family protein n=1 Tax=Polymorphospora rubra TaxID=338584 RepID=UPI0033CA9CE1